MATNEMQAAASPAAQAIPGALAIQKCVTIPRTPVA